MTQYGVFLPNLGPFADARALSDLAARAESAGWDGFFVWDHVLFDAESRLDVVDPWIALAAIALATERVRIGALMTPISRRRPWKLARETTSLDQLSGGRLILGAGLGFPADAEFELFGEYSEDRVRAARLDEGLEVLAGLWTEERYVHHGEHFEVGPVTFTPRPVQQPRPPVWIAGWWPNKAPYRRAARWDGVVPELVGGSQPGIDDVRAISDFITEQRGSIGGFDIVLNGHDVLSRPDLDDFASAGVTWWLERCDPDRGFSVAEAEAIIDRGPQGS